MVRLAAAALSGLVLASKATALQSIVAKGSKFFYEDGSQFFMKGIAYQEDPSGAGGENADGKYIDPLADAKACKRDVPILAKAGTNTIRVYAVDPEKNHDECMKLLSDAGIYVVADLSEPSVSINRDDPKWDLKLYERYTAVIDDLAQYDNTIGFFAGNEVSNNSTNTDASAFVKAAVRDSKKYIKDKGYRWLGVGYAANDDADIRQASAHYFNCGEQDAAIDFWGYNIYSWCGKSSFEKSGYNVQVEFFSNYSVPIFLAEYGCNSPGGAEGRTFDDTRALYSDKMTPVFSGGIVYMYMQETNDYGLVEIEDGKAKTMKNYNALSSAVEEAKPSSTSEGSYNPTNSPAACPVVSEDWDVNGDGLPPTPDAGLCKCMFDSLACVPSDDLKTKEFGEIFGYICGNKPELCAGIIANTTTGVYGAYSMCEDKQKLAWVMNELYLSQNSASDACDSGGNGQLRSNPQAASSCDSKLEAASSSVKWATTATAASREGGSQNSDDDEEGFGIMNRNIESVFSLGSFAVGLYVVVAAAVGGAMVVL